jgi:aspartate aminotransferase-like enzyme
MAKMARAGVTALNLQLFAQRPANALTAVRVPPDMDGIRLLHVLHDRLGAVVAGGQSQLKGKIFRLAHLGYVDELDVIAAIAALENALHALGHKFTMGAGLQAAQGLFSERTEGDS